jgi:hypothetical protein
MPRRALAFLCALVVVLGGCRTGPFGRGDADADTAPEFDRNAAAASVFAGYFVLLQRLVQSGPAEQAEIVVATQREYELAPTGSHQLRYALALAAPGHAGTDPESAQRLLRELLASPELLSPAERALAMLELMKVDQQLLIGAENRRLQTEVTRIDRDRVAALSRQLKTEVEENARLRKALDEAQAKLDAIANIERSINERNSNSEGRQP